MDDTKLKALLDEVEQKRKQAEAVAQMQAMKFVSSNQLEDRVSAQQYLRDAKIWQEAAALIRQHRAC